MLMIMLISRPTESSIQFAHFRDDIHKLFSIIRSIQMIRHHDRNNWCKLVMLKIPLRQLWMILMWSDGSVEIQNEHRMLQHQTWLLLMAMITFDETVSGEKTEIALRVAKSQKWQRDPPEDGGNDVDYLSLRNKSSTGGRERKNIERQRKDSV